MTGKTGKPAAELRAAERGAFGTRFAVWRASLSRSAESFVSQPEPRTIGHFARGRQLVAGNFLLGGSLVEAPDTRLWDIAAPHPDFAQEAQGFAWLDDLAAVGSAAARDRAQDWTFGWIERFGRGDGPGWTPGLAGRRLIRWINHAFFILQGRPKPEADAYFRSLTTQTVWLSRHWSAAPPGLPRFEALVGTICAGLALTGLGRHVGPAVAALAQDCTSGIDSQGGIPTRNPEELLEVFSLLLWADQALAAADQPIPEPLTAALDRIAPTLRALRHADGGLARFHGGGRGLEGRLDAALATSPVKTVAPGFAMGFARMAAHRTTVIVDAASPPAGAAGARGHASTLAFELTSGRRPLIVSCGSGAAFGPEWRRAGRATASHSTLSIDGFSSSRFPGDGREVLTELAPITVARLFPADVGTVIHLGHGGWSVTHGLTHRRDLSLSPDGRRLAGLDTLLAATPEERERFEALMTRTHLEGAAYAVRFHLHPDVDASLDLGGTAVSLALKSGEIWVFRPEGRSALSLEPSVYLERGRLAPRATHQIVLSGRARDFHTEVGWTLAKAQDTPLAIRDLDRDDLTVPL
ncbi:heparinase II/III family protein [Neotabrizicola shimadae]|uniref:Heparinase II/III family protein n=1 Tax=Neotabrizicola shimadae TaxID=2807096 RepID=A0A8G1EDK1_9RHOB|nr:heparinase II/III family protein [Neotabrizicola shimadae]QYZ69509.1 heparinase II/III family protein [Neotabrizicola shimadae]